MNQHVPVLVDRVVALLHPALDADGAVLVDATVGLGGHSAALLGAHPRLQLVGLDRDQQALDVSAQRLSEYGDRVRLVHAVYDELPAVLDQLGLPGVHAVLFDLGVSSLQLDERDRGFSYAHDTTLDMRMDQSATLTAADVVNTYSVEQLTSVLREYGEERFARRIARAIVQARGVEPFRSSARLVELVRDQIPAPARRTGGNPAKRTFQALRIEVNDELGTLRRALPAAANTLLVGGRLVAVSYHSLEDRAVKRMLGARSTVSVPKDMPVVPDAHRPTLRLLTRGAERPDEDEVRRNPRAASARLRAAQCLRRAA